ncbi:MAG: CPBP family intramembrane glutamic endopeptidase [Candidatus Anstonellaceae archaeon]
MANAAILKKSKLSTAEWALLIVCAACSVAIATFPPFDDVRIISTALLFSSLALLLASFGRSIKEGLSYLCLDLGEKRLPKLIIYGFAGFLALALISAVISFLLYNFGFFDALKVKEKVLSLSLLSLISAITLSPIGEEMLFRGYVFRKAQQLISKKKASKASFLFAALVSSFLFSLMHISYGSVTQLVSTFFLGIFLCALSQVSESLIPPIIAHASFNLLSVATLVLA